MSVTFQKFNSRSDLLTQGLNVTQGHAKCTPAGHVSTLPPLQSPENLKFSCYVFRLIPRTLYHGKIRAFAAVKFQCHKISVVNTPSYLVDVFLVTRISGSSHIVVK